MSQNVSTRSALKSIHSLSVDRSNSRSPIPKPIFLLISLLFIVSTYLILRSFGNHPGKVSYSRSPELSIPKFHYHNSDDLSNQNLTEFIPDQDVLKGKSIMPKMGNATAKAELGRATWKFMHTMTQRFPEHPTSDERAALKAFIYLFSRLYPCGECAHHFQLLLQQYPPQTSSRNAASLHLCSLHNLVNERLGKPEYNCTTLAENYDCGCAHDDPDEKTEGNQTKLTGFELPTKTS
ncbi:ERV/ALR sulfhydryl oxidase domain-containing protein [Melampsora americana]|nr:ERV/ALR sulfhydryl oxidase domain-containing protein [Melampsora americana]